MRLDRDLIVFLFTQFKDEPDFKSGVTLEGPRRKTRDTRQRIVRVDNGRDTETSKHGNEFVCRKTVSGNFSVDKIPGRLCSGEGASKRSKRIQGIQLKTGE